MGKAKRSDKRKPKAGGHRPAAKKPKSSEGTQSWQAVSPLDDTQLPRVADVPNEAQIDEVAHHLSPADRKGFQRMRRLLAEHLGSHAAARLWLVSAGTGFETTALDAIRAGEAKLVLATLEAQWGASPTYA